MHEDDRDRGCAIYNSIRARSRSPRPRSSAPTLLRTHYPLHPYMHELADQLGLMIWSEIPVYQIRHRATWRSRRCASPRASCADNMIANGNHPSVFALVDRQRAHLAAGRGAGRLLRARGATPRKALDPHASRRATRSRATRRRLPARVRAAGHHRRQRLLRLVSRARTARSPTATPLAAVPRRCAPATPTRRS